jgi:dTDP-4-dehydrorhamnose reductase
VKVLVIGASGLLGTKLAQLALDLGHSVQSAYGEHKPQFGEAIHLDITSDTGVLKCISRAEPDVVFNAASITDVDLCEEHPELAMRVNGQAVGIVARACSETGAFLVHISTDYVFDGQQGHYTEDDTKVPINVYGKSKLLGEKELQTNISDYLIARTSVLYGWGRTYRPNFATWIISKLGAGERVRVVTGQYSSPTFNTQLARMLLEAAERNLVGTIHMAAATRINRFEFALKMSKVFALDSELLTPSAPESLNWKAERPWDSSLDVSKASRILRNKPSLIDEALEEFRKEMPVS